MKRREFLKSALVGAGAATLAGCEGPQPAAPPAEGEGGAPAISTGQKVQWRLTSSFPRSLDTLFGGAELLAQRVEAMSGGNFKIRVYPAGELVPGLQVLDAVQQGTVQAGQTASYYYIGKNPALAFDACVPFGMTARQKTAWLVEGGGLDLLNAAFADFNTITFPAGNTGAQMGGWFKTTVDSLADLDGLNMRIPGLGGKVMDQLGVNVQVLAGGDIYPALERGAIDATEWVGPYDDEKLGFHKVAKNYYYPGWWEPGPNLSFLVNREAFEALPAEYRAMLEAATREGAKAMMTRYDAKNPAAWKRLMQTDITVRRFPDDTLAAAREAAAELLESEAAGDARYARILESWKTFRDESFAWFGAAELAYAQFAMGDVGLPR